MILGERVNPTEIFNTENRLKSLIGHFQTTKIILRCLRHHQNNLRIWNAQTLHRVIEGESLSKALIAWDVCGTFCKSQDGAPNKTGANRFVFDVETYTDFFIHAPQKKSSYKMDQNGG